MANAMITRAAQVLIFVPAFGKMYPCSDIDRARERRRDLGLWTL
jgi:hypothetical protein